MKLFHLLIFGKKQTNKQTNNQQNVFDAILERKKVFLESKIRKLKKLKNRDFSKRVTVFIWIPKRQPRISTHLKKAPIPKAEKVNKRPASNKRPPHPTPSHTNSNKT